MLQPLIQFSDELWPDNSYGENTHVWRFSSKEYPLFEYSTLVEHKNVNNQKHRECIFEDVNCTFSKFVKNSKKNA